MRRCMVLLMLPAMLAMHFACAQNKPAGATADPSAGADRQQSAAGTGAAAPANAGAAADLDMPVPPKDAQWTIYCKTYSAPDHILVAKAMRDQLRRDRSMPDWYVVHGEGESTLYYGFYRVISETEDPKDAKEAARYQRDRQRIDQLTDAMGDRPFRYCHAAPFAGPNPDGPPEWNLVNAKGHWSVQIASFTGSPLRKQYAIDAVRQAREMGVEAYYYHGPTASSVCVGVWPEEAVRRPEEARAANPADPVLVLPGAVPDTMQKEMTTPDGRRIQTVKTSVTIEDPTILATMKQYPEHAVNGELVVIKGKDPRNHQVKQEYEPSFLVEIPKAEASILRGDAPPEDLIFPTQPSGPGKSAPGKGGRLKSIGG